MKLELNSIAYVTSNILKVYAHISIFILRILNFKNSLKIELQLFMGFTQAKSD